MNTNLSLIIHLVISDIRSIPVTTFHSYYTYLLTPFFIQLHLCFKYISSNWIIVAWLTTTSNHLHDFVCSLNHSQLFSSIILNHIFLDLSFIFLNRDVLSNILLTIRFNPITSVTSYYFSIPAFEGLSLLSIHPFIVSIHIRSFFSISILQSLFHTFICFQNLNQKLSIYNFFPT